MTGQKVRIKSLSVDFLKFSVASEQQRIKHVKSDVNNLLHAKSHARGVTLFGGMEEWRNGGMEEWRNDGMMERNSGIPGIYGIY